jgi:hypothetical protein
MATETKKMDRGLGVKVLFMAILYSLLFFTGCQSINPLPIFGVGNATPEEARIRKLMKWHSGRVEVYREFRTVFTARAVYLSDEIRGIAVNWEARSKLMNPEERADLEKRFLNNDESLIRVLVGFYTPDEELNDLDHDNSVWIPYLKMKDGTIRQAACFGVGSEEASIYMRFLKWDLAWSKLYMLCFPYSPDMSDSDNGFINMVISGPSGQGEILLKITPPVDQPS